MTTPDLERRIRTWFADEIGEVEAAPSSVRTFLAAIPESMPREQGLFGRRAFVLLAAAVLLIGLLAGAFAVGSGLLKLPSIVPDPARSPLVDDSPELFAFDCAVEQATARSRTDQWQAGPAPSGRVRSGWIAAWGVGDTPQLVLVNPQNGDVCSLVAFDGYGPPSDGTPGGGPLVWSPDGSSLAIVVRGGENGATDLFVWSRRGLAGPILQVEAPRSLLVPSWSPDGSRLAVGSNPPWTVRDGPLAPASVWIVNSDGSAAHALQADCVACLGGSALWSPSGDRVALWTNSDQDASVGGIAVGSADGLTSTLVPGTGPTSRLLGWADEHSVRVLEADGDLVDIPLDAGADRIDHGATALRQDSELALSPDGTRVAQIQDGELGYGDLMTCDLSSGTCRAVMHDPAAFGLVWSPDGQTIAYLIGPSVCGPCPSPPPSPPGLWLINADGTGQRQLSADALYIVLTPYSTWDTTVPAVWQPRW
jgi:hypothetical protein